MEKAESRRFEVVKVDFNLEAVLKVLRANAVSCSRLWSCAYEVTFLRIVVVETLSVICIIFYRAAELKIQTKII